MNFVKLCIKPITLYDYRKNDIFEIVEMVIIVLYNLIFFDIVFSYFFLMVMCRIQFKIIKHI